MAAVRRPHTSGIPGLYDEVFDCSVTKRTLRLAQLNDVPSRLLT